MATGRRRVVLACVVLIGAAAVAFVVTRAAPPPGPATNAAFESAALPDAPAVVWAVGDGANGSDSARAVAQRITDDRPDRVLYLGDVYPDGSHRDFLRGFASVYGKLARITAPTPGNHDWPAHLEGYDPYWSATTGAPTPPWYSFRAGGWNIISLNSEAPHGPASAQLRWLTSQLRNTRGTCTVAFWHRPLQSAGRRHGDQGDVAPLWNALRGRATLVLNGHDHDLQRLRPRDGITQLVVGAGGEDRYELEPDERVLFGDDRRDGALRLALRPGEAQLSVVAADGAVLDRSSTPCLPGTS